MSHDFTVERYREIVSAAASRFRFLRFGAHTVPTSDAVALWRHDIDFSPHRALDLARIDAASGVVATWFVQLSSRYYSAFEPETAGLLREIGALGHDIGLHFDAEALSHRETPDYERRLIFEARVLEEIAETKVHSFSLHNPTTVVGVQFDALSHVGLANASAPSLREQFTYCSDSNGLWRNRSLDEIVRDAGVAKLYALTHPEWWQDSAMAPRQRIQRCLDGRAARAGRHYDELLARHGRPNIGKAVGE
jgi:hypothetical protein